MVGREAELAAPRGFDSTRRRDATLPLVTIVGAAGVGKSRLMQSSSTIERTSAVLRGRCLPYGDGITFWALARRFDKGRRRRRSDPKHAAGRNCERSTGKERDVAERVARPSGCRRRPSRSGDVLGARRLLETLATRPVVVVFDDIHWAEATFLDLIEHISETVERTGPACCSARPELLDSGRRGGRRAAGSRGALEPSRTPRPSRSSPSSWGRRRAAQLQQRVTNTAEGNPLYVEQISSMLIEDGTSGRTTAVAGHGDPAVDIPPTISALLASRLDQLGRTRSAGGEAASVIGQTSSVGAVAALLPDALADRRAVPRAALSKELIVRRSTFDGEDGFSFRHILIRDAAYGGC